MWNNKQSQVWSGDWVQTYIWITLENIFLKSRYRTNVRMRCTAFQMKYRYMNWSMSHATFWQSLNKILVKIHSMLKENKAYNHSRERMDNFSRIIWVLYDVDQVNNGQTKSHVKICVCLKALDEIIVNSCCQQIWTLHMLHVKNFTASCDQMAICIETHKFTLEISRLCGATNFPEFT